MPVVRGAGAFGVEKAQIDLLLQQRMIVRHQLNAVFAQPIHPGIADMRDHYPVAMKEQHDDRRSDRQFLLEIQEPGTTNRFDTDRAVGDLDCLPHERRNWRFRIVAQSAPDHIHDGPGGDTARHIATGVTAHAVGQHQQADFADGGDAVLVQAAKEAGVGLAGDFELLCEGGSGRQVESNPRFVILSSSIFSPEIIWSKRQARLGRPT